MAPITLKATGKPFSQFANLNSEADLSKTWRVCTKVKDSLENGSRLENLAWRLWFIHNVMDTTAHFKKLSPNTTRKLDKEKASMQASHTPPPNNVRRTQRQQRTRGSKRQRQQYPHQPHHECSSSISSETPVYLRPEQQQLQQRQQQQQQITSVGAASTAQGIMSQLQIAQNTSLSPAPPSQQVQQAQPVTGAQTSVSVAPQPVMNHTTIIVPETQQLTYDSDYPPPRSTTENFLLPQFSSDQATDQVIELQDDAIFKDILNPDMMSWMPQARDHYMTTDPYSLQPASQQQMINQLFQPENAFYIIDETMSPMPRATLHDKILSTLPPEKVASAQQALSPGSWRLSSQNNADSSKHKVIINTTPSEGKNPICSNCQTTNTPLWRRSINDELLCNACGLYAKLHNAPRPKHLKNAPQPTGEGMETMCSNCATTTTPLWRRDNEGAPLCNACGLYLKLHNAKRPLSMKTDVIKKRQRGMDMGQSRAIRVINHDFDSNQFLEEDELPPHHPNQQQRQQEQYPLSSTPSTASHQFQNFVFSPTTFL